MTSAKPDNIMPLFIDDVTTLSDKDNRRSRSEPMQDITGNGILPARAIRAMIAQQQIQTSFAQGINDNQLQPASLDLRLGDVAYRIRASFLPGPTRRVMDKLEALACHKIKLSPNGPGTVLETGCVYLLPLMETVGLPKDITGLTNPKSSTGRIDVFTRVITDYGTEFDKIEPGYKGPLYLEVSPRTFPIIVRVGSRLSQIRFRCYTDRRRKRKPDNEARRLHDEIRLVDGDFVDIDGGLGLSVDLVGEGKTGLVGYRGKRHARPIDVDSAGALDLHDYWEPIYRCEDRQLILDPDEFYILASREAITIPPSHAAEMVPFNPLVGEFRVHYAGFFDPGFGAGEAGSQGSHAVLEVRSREVPFILEHGQIIGRLVYEQLTEPADMLYGTQDLQSSYQNQGLRLSKHFRQV